MNDSMPRLLLFTVRENRYALDLHHIAEVLGVPLTFPVPWAPSWIRGAMNFHGRVVAVLDLAGFMHSAVMTPNGNTLVLHTGLANFALGVDSVGSIIPAADVLEEDESDHPMVEKLLIMPDGEVKKLAIERLLEKVGEEMQR